MNIKQYQPITMEFQSQESLEAQGEGNVGRGEKETVPQSMSVRSKFNGEGFYL